MDLDADERSLAARLIQLPASMKLLIAALTDAAILLLAAVATVRLTRPDLVLPPAELRMAVLAPALTLPALYAAGTYRTVTRFVTPAFLRRLGTGLLLALVLLRLAVKNFGVSEVTWNAILLFGLLGFAALGAERFLARNFLRSGRGAADPAIRVVIYGAGEAGRQLAAALGVGGRHRVVGFLDERAALINREIMGAPVYAPASVRDLKHRGLFDQIMLAIPSASRARRREILESLEQLAVRVMVVPSLGDLTGGRVRVDDLRDVQPEDILGRDAIEPDYALLDRYLRGKTVLVTGAGGSIGSELSRNALRRGVRKLVLYEIAECALYQIERELRSGPEAAQCEIVAVLGSVTDSRALTRVLREHQVQTVYHAAAYKHVPLGEKNALSFVENNVLGTLAVTQAAVTEGVENFVLISTDKAVRPTSVMGATKRACELIVQCCAAEQRKLRMSIVRFGNVLGSSGSVVPLFKEQIRKGGPITVTHPEMTRYFMTIQEAAQLAIQAGSMGGQGEVLLLDMGEPVRIADLAARMIHLSGLRIRSEASPDGDIAICFTGTRAGEKLHEELLIGKNPKATAHPRIFLAQERSLPGPVLLDGLARLRTELDRGDARRVMEELRGLVAREVPAPGAADNWHRDLPVLSSRAASAALG